MTEQAFVDAFEAMVATLRAMIPWDLVVRQAAVGTLDLGQVARLAIDAAQRRSRALAEPLAVEYALSHRHALSGAVAALRARQRVVKDVPDPFVYGGVEGIPELTLTPSFTMSADAAARWATEYSYHLVNRVGVESIGNLRSVIEAGLRNHLTSEEIRQAVQAMPGFGLHAQWARAVTRYWNDQIATGKSVLDTARDTARYEAKLVRARARNIARTEIHRAVNAGKIGGWRDTARAGFYDASQAEKEWLTGPLRSATLKGVRVCPICRPMAGVVVPLDQPFLTDWGPIDHPPIHPSCRCTIMLHPFGSRTGFDLDINEVLATMTPDEIAAGL